MAILLIIVLLLVCLYFWGNGPRKSAAQSIVAAEDLGRTAKSLALKTPTAAGKIRDHAVHVVAEASETAKVLHTSASEKGRKGAEETKHYLKGFLYDVGVERRRIKSERNKVARAKRISKMRSVS